MYSLNVPVPSALARRAADLAADLPAARGRGRDEHTLVVKRLGTGDRAAYARLETRAREALAGTAPFAARAVAVECFETPASGPGPVVYVRIESPELERLHRRLCEAFDPVDGVEADEYVPHVTVARGGRPAAARELAAREFDPIEWAVEELVFWDAARATAVSRVSLPYGVGGSPS